MHIDTQLEKLKNTWGYTTEELNHIRLVMAAYAMDAIMDSEVRKEAESILQEPENE